MMSMKKTVKQTSISMQVEKPQKIKTTSGHKPYNPQFIQCYGEPKNGTSKPDPQNNKW